MRLLEFVYSLCDENNDEFSQDTFDKELKQCKEKRGRPTREIIAEIDKRYKIERIKRFKHIDDIIRDIDEDSSVSNKNIEANGKNGTLDDNCSLSSISINNDETSVQSYAEPVVDSVDKRDRARHNTSS